MSDTSFLLDGDAPRLASAPVPQPVVPIDVAESSAHLSPQPSASNAPLPAPDPNALPSLPLKSPVLTDPRQAPTLPSSVPAASGGPVTTPTLTTTAGASEATDETLPNDEIATAPTNHPMSHLMPQKSAASEASKRAAEIRAAQKAKAKKVKIGMLLGALVFAIVVGPPLFSWLSNAINEAGKTSTVEEPAPAAPTPAAEEPAPAAPTQP